MTTCEDHDVLDETLVMLPDQREQMFYRGKWGASRGGQRAGKTTSWCYWCWLERMEVAPESNFVAVGATYEQLRRGIFATLIDLFWKHGLAEGVDFTYSLSQRPWIKLDNGAKLHSWSAEIVGRVRSANVQTMILEEPQTWGPSAEDAFISLVGRLTHNERTAKLYPWLEPQGRLSFNPTGVGPGHWLYELLEKRWPDKGWRVWQMSVRKNSLLLDVDPGYVAQLETSVPEHRHGVEIDGDYATSGGDAYRSYDDAVNGKPDAIPDGLPLFGLHPKELLWALDFNVGHQRSVIAQAHVQKPIVDYIEGRQRVQRLTVPGWQRRVFYFLDEIALDRAGAEDVVIEFLSREGGEVERDATGKIVRVTKLGRYGEHAKAHGVSLYGDATGGAQSSLVSSDNAVVSNWLAIYHGLKRHGIVPKWRVQSRNPPPAERLNEMNLQFRAGGGTGGRTFGRDGFGLVADPLVCVELVTDWRQNRIKPGTNDIDKSDKSESGLRRTHAGDAGGYLVWYERKREEGPITKLDIGIDR